MTTFESLGLNAAILKSLSGIGYDKPTPIQRDCIPLILEGRDIMGLAQTGTGKTAAFSLPLIQMLMGIGTKPEGRTVRALILAPTRELANQIAANVRSFVRHSHLKVGVVVGGQSIGAQAKLLDRGLDILVATPGRLLDLADRKAVRLDQVKYLVLDEADQMLDLGFIHSLKKIARMLARPRTTLLFSATMPKLINDLAQAYLVDPVRVEVAPAGKTADKVNQSVHHLSNRGKADLLTDLLNSDPKALSLVFARTKHGAEKLMKLLVTRGFAAASIHGNKSQGQRDRAIRGFRDGEIRVLVATDVAARGIDIPGVTHVYNFDLPEVPEQYVHRIGRTARAGAEGIAVSFVSPDQAHLLRGIEKLIGLSIAVASGEAASYREAQAAKKEAGREQAERRNARFGGPRREGAAPARKRPQHAEGDAPTAPRKPKPQGAAPFGENRRDGASRDKGPGAKPANGNRFKQRDAKGGKPRWAKGPKRNKSKAA